MRRPAQLCRRALAGAAVCALAAGCSDRYIYTPGPPAMDGAGGDDGSTPDTNMPPGPCTADLVGFASLGDSTTGGIGGPVMMPTTQAEMQTLADTDGPMIIRIQGVISLSAQIDLRTTDKTIEGVGMGSGFTGAGIRIKDTGNVIVRNLMISKALKNDAITIENSNHVWVDHCDFSSDTTSPADTYDSLVDINHGADYVTVSWTKFHEHNRDVSFIGNSDDLTGNAANDPGHLHVTVHHNSFINVPSHTPSLRFGTAHVLNNYYKNIMLAAVVSRMGGQVLAERNYFVMVGTPLATQSDSPMDGYLQDFDNSYDPKDGNGPNNLTQTSQTSVPYQYTPTPINQVPAQVMACAGTGIIK